MDKIACSIVLHQHTLSLIRPLVNSILSCSICEKLFLIDNSPTSRLSVLATNPRVEYIFNNKNIGYGPAHNIAIRKAMSIAKYHVVINPDISFSSGTLETIYTYLEAHLEVGHVMPKTLYPDGRIQHTCKLLPTPTDLILRRFIPDRLFTKRRKHFELQESGYNQIMEVPYLSGCFMFLRMEALTKVGLFDEQFFMYPEDIDLTRRIHKQFKTVFFPHAEVVHGYERGSYKSIKLFYIHLINIVKYFNKWGWVFDKDRKLINKKIIKQIAELKGYP